MLRWSPEPEPKATAAPGFAETPPLPRLLPRPLHRDPASLARARPAGCLGEVSRELIGRANDQWKRAAAPGAPDGEEEREGTAPNQPRSRWAWLGRREVIGQL